MDDGRIGERCGIGRFYELEVFFWRTLSGAVWSDIGEKARLWRSGIGCRTRGNSGFMRGAGVH